MTDSVDPVDQAVIGQAFLAIAQEMGAKLVRSAYSTVVREAKDSSAALLDAEGHLVAQAETIPMQLGSLGMTFRPCAEVCPVGALEEGDFYITNDPYHGGQHLPDVFIFTPIFFDGGLVGFSASVAHHLDLGGGSPGLNAGATDVYQEGLIIPPSKYNLERDWNGGPLERFIAANIRVPEQTIGDFNAEFAANSVGAARVRELCRKYGAETVKGTMQGLLAYSERRFRAALAEVPDGVYEGEDAVDDDGLDEVPLRVKAKVTVAGESATVDFAGTSAQVTRNLNSPFASTVSAAFNCLKSVLTSADIPFNDGCKRPVTVQAPYGSLLNPRPPAPVRARMEACYRAYNAVMKALAKALPERVIAAGYDTTFANCLSFLSGDGYRVVIDLPGGGYGASAGVDGADALSGPLENCSSTPVEVMDMEYDFFRVVGFALRPDSCGHGRTRGGLGLMRTYEILKDGVNFAIYADRFRIPAEGLLGGEEGRCGSCEVIRDGKTIPVRSKDSLVLEKGDLLVVATGGGGGYGPPSERAAEVVARDVADGLIDEATARKVYGRIAQAESG